MKKYLTMIAAAMLTAACSNDKEEMVTPTTGDAVSFAAFADDGDATRAKGEINTTPILKGWTWDLTGHVAPAGGDVTDLRGFGVFGSYTGKLTYENTTVTPDFMYNQQVKPDGENWVYNPVKYWPNEKAEYVSFFGYAPYEADPQDDGRCIIDISDNYVLGDPWVNYRISADPWGLDSDPNTESQVDLMYATKYDDATSKYLTWTDVQHYNGDQQLQDVYLDSKIKLTFRHALACVGDAIDIKASQELLDKIDGYATVKVNKLTITYKNLTTKARLVLNTHGGQTANWKEIISGELTTSRTYVKELDTPITLSGTETIICEGDGLFYIPLRVKGTDAAYADIAVDYTVDNGVSTYNGTAKGKFDLDYNLEGKKQAIHLVLNKNLSLEHLVLSLGSPATDPSFSRIMK